VKHWKILIGVLVILSLGTVACTSTDTESGSSAPEGISTGNRARDFTLKSLDGEKVSLSDFRGDVVLINFWATWCGPCRAEIPDFEQVYGNHKDKGLVILGLNQQESPAVIEPFAEELGMTYPVLLDEQGQVMSEYRILGLPTSVLVDRDGVIQVRHTGTMTANQLESQLDDLLSGK
jgi:peroxiredoxin